MCEHGVCERMHDGTNASRQVKLSFKTEILSMGSVSLSMRLNVRNWPGIKAQNAEVILYTIPLTLLQIVVHTESPDLNFETRLLVTLQKERDRLDLGFDRYAQLPFALPPACRLPQNRSRVR